MTVPPATARFSFGPWLFGKHVDLFTFGGSAVLALFLVLLGRVLGFGGGALPEWGWIAFVLAIDVAHVYSTAFRTYFDFEEVRRHAFRYLGLPVVLYAIGVALHSADGLLFWSVLAYVAVFHFIRQQVGWLALYRVKERQQHGDKPHPVSARWEKRVEVATMYSVMLFPMIFWHANLETRRFFWFVQGDFIDVAELLRPVVPWSLGIVLLLLVGYALIQIRAALSTRTVALGKHLLLLTTALAWNVGIVFTNSDFDFTVTNIIVHGVPYLVLLWSYARARVGRAPANLTHLILRGGLGAFLGVLLLLAFVEEWAWHFFVWPDHEALFGTASPRSAEWLSWLVPLLALPQATHYVLDGLLWRSKDTKARETQRAALGLSEPSALVPGMVGR